MNEDYSGLLIVSLMASIAAMVTALTPIILKWINRKRDRDAAAVPVVTASMTLVEGLREEIDRQKAALAESKDDVELYGKRIDRLEDRNDQLMQNVSEITNNLAEMRVENRQLVARVEELSKENTLLKQQIQELTRQIAALTAENGKLRDEIAALRRE